MKRKLFPPCNRSISHASPFGLLNLFIYNTRTRIWNLTPLLGRRGKAMVISRCRKLNGRGLALICRLVIEASLTHTHTHRRRYTHVCVSACNSRGMSPLINLCEMKISLTQKPLSLQFELVIWRHKNVIRCHDWQLSPARDWAGRCMGGTPWLSCPVATAQTLIKKAAAVSAFNFVLCSGRRRGHQRRPSFWYESVSSNCPTWPWLLFSAHWLVCCSSWHFGMHHSPRHLG